LRTIPVLAERKADVNETTTNQSGEFSLDLSPALQTLAPSSGARGRRDDGDRCRVTARSKDES
jgi:hypothetical protein